MVIKSKDDVRPDLGTLRDLRSQATLTKKQRELIDIEIDRVAAGNRGEQEAAYQIDFHLKDSKNWAVIHDLRIDHNGRVAQIDHVLIGRMLDIILIESKNFTTAIRLSAEGEFQVKTRYGWRGMSSPVEQNKRHLRVLDEFIRDAALAPTRLGLRIQPTYRQWILIPPECNFVRASDQVEIIKMDMFARRMDDWASKASLSEVLSMAKIVSSETLMAFGEKLAKTHQAARFDFAAKFGVRPDPAPARVAEEPAPIGLPERREPTAAVCAGCNAQVDAKVARFCRQNKARFAGRILCRDCQQQPDAKAICAECGTAVDAKVVAFCRFNSKRFESRVLCRQCQTLLAQA